VCPRAGSRASQATVIPHLHRVGDEVPPGPEAPTAIFQPDAGGLPPIDAAALSRAPEGDGLLVSLEASAHTVRAAQDRYPVLAQLAELLTDELAALRGACSELRQPGPGGEPDPRSYALSDRYALLVAGAACLGVWRQHALGTTGFLGDPAWAASVLTRVLGRLGCPAVTIPDECQERLLEELLHRFDDARSFDLYATPLGR
jgi:hypothetical protein